MHSELFRPFTTLIFPDFPPFSQQNYLFSQFFFSPLVGRLSLEISGTLAFFPSSVLDHSMPAF